MFAQLKVLRKLSNEQDVLTTHEERFSDMLKSFSEQEEKLKALQQQLHANIEKAMLKQQKIEESISLLNNMEEKNESLYK